MRTFAYLAELDAFADRLGSNAEQADGRVADWLADAGERIADRMRDEVPKDTLETHDSITVETDGRSVSVGPTNRDDRGRPVGFFIEVGPGNRAPDPFVARTAVWAAEALPLSDAEQVWGDW